MEFRALMEKYLDREIIPDVEMLLDMKIRHSEIATGKRVDRINAYLDRTIAETEAVIASLSDDKIQSWDELNALFLEVLDKK